MSVVASTKFWGPGSRRCRLSPADDWKSWNLGTLYDRDVRGEHSGTSMFYKSFTTHTPLTAWLQPGVGSAINDAVGRHLEEILLSYCLLST